MASIIGQQIQNLQQEYQKDKQAHWQQMATVVNLIITASISCYTYQHGASSIRITPEMLEQYITQLIVPELQIQQLQDGSSSLDNLPILKSTCIKFVYMFRNQIPEHFLADFVNLFADYLRSENQVNQSYAAAAIEKLMIRKGSNGKVVLTESSISQEMLAKLLQNLCELLRN